MGGSDSTNGSGPYRRAGVPAAVRGGRLLFAGFDIVAMGVAITDTTGSLVNFFSFFTIESNMVITGLVYAVLLANAEVGLTAAWVDSALHQVTPAVLLADWYPYPFLDPRHSGGYGRVAVFAVVLALVFALLALGVSAAGRWRSLRA